MGKREIQSQIDFDRLHFGFNHSTLTLTLEDAVEIALNRNLDLAVSEIQYEIQYEVQTRAKYAMLPKLIVDTENSHRTVPFAAFSESLEPGVPPAPPSISSSKRINRYNFSYVWSLLDFGVSYFRYQQEKDKSYVQQFEYERQIQTLIQKVVKSYWLCAGEQIWYAQYSSLVENLERIKSSIQKQTNEGRISLVEGSTKLDVLLTAQDEMGDFIRQTIQDFADFKLLLGVPPETEIKFLSAEPEVQNMPSFNVMDLEQLALMNRPELYSADMKELIWRDEVYVALLQFFPDISPFITSSYDGDRFIISNKWTTLGLKSTWSLLSIPQRIMDRKIALKQLDLNDYNRLLMSFSVISQVRLAVLTYGADLERFRILHHLWKTRSNFGKVIKKEYSLGGSSELQLIINRLASLEAEYKARHAWADAQSSFELINNAIGLPFYLKQSPDGILKNEETNGEKNE